MIGHFGVHVVHRVTVYLVDQGTQQGVGGQHEEGAEDGLQGEPGAAGGPDRGHAHRVAAVLMPRMLPDSRMMTPAPRKPMPETM